MSDSAQCRIENHLTAKNGCYEVEYFSYFVNAFWLQVDENEAGAML
ncbi:hypothetical protein H6F61_09680 [Cyanobacteria bacterium FACHB-472]|nr:hypothetical protein [Cyanobacteria bacterium FACHB-472]